MKLRPIGLLVLLLLISACASSARDGAPDLATARVVDLSHVFDETTLYWPTSPSAFEHRELHYGPTPAGFFYSSYAVCTPEHGGTHLDAPIHFAEGRWTADQIPLRRLIGPAVVIDVSGQASSNPDYRLTAGDIASWEQRNGRIPEDAIVVLRTGWASRWPDRSRYLGDDTPGDASNLHFPSYGEEATRLLMQRKVAALGVDTASIDFGPSQDFIVHQIASAANVVGLENLTNLESLPEKGGWIIALPMKIGKGSGGPLRAVALLPER